MHAPQIWVFGIFTSNEDFNEDVNHYQCCFLLYLPFLGVARARENGGRRLRKKQEVINIVGGQGR